jgi:tight adherence protein C
MPLYALSALVFIGAASILFFVIYIFLPKKTSLKERLEGLTSDAGAPVYLETPPSAWQKFLGRLGKNIPLRPQEYGKYMRMLVAGGIKKERVPVFMGVKMLLTILLPGAYLMFYGIPVEKDMKMMVITAVAFIIAGFLIPTFWLRSKVQKRQLSIFHDLPDLLDLMTVCVEAGLGIDAAMIKVYEDEQFQKSPLSRELRIAIQETRAGKPRLEALRDMGERTMVEDLKSFAAMLIQTERLGTSLAQSLRVYSDSLRVIRRQRAEEAAAKTTIKLLFPLIIFIFPALLLVILGPSAIRVMRLFGSL